MRMQMQQAKTPVAQMMSPIGSGVRPVPAQANLRPSTFLVGSSGSFQTVSARTAAPVRGTRLIVEAAKKSVGDLAKPELEGKTVLVIPYDI